MFNSLCIYISFISYGRGEKLPWFDATAQKVINGITKVCEYSRARIDTPRLSVHNYKKSFLLFCIDYNNTYWVIKNLPKKNQNRDEISYSIFFLRPDHQVDRPVYGQEACPPARGGGGLRPYRAGYHPRREDVRRRQQHRGGHPGAGPPTEYGRRGQGELLVFNIVKPIFHWKLGLPWLPNANEINIKKKKCAYPMREIWGLGPNATYIPLICVGVLR